MAEIRDWRTREPIPPIDSTPIPAFETSPPSAENMETLPDAPAWEERAGMPPPPAHPALHAAASLVPGAGQAWRGEPVQGLAWFASVTTLFFQRQSVLLQQLGFNLWQYNIYDAWRDARGAPARGLTVFENYIGFIDPRNAWDPIGASMVTSAAVSRASDGGGYPGLRKPGLMATYGGVGLGEEALFRGFLFPQLSDWLGSPWAGAPASSLLFAAFHGINGKEDLRLNPMAQRFGFGMLLSWMMVRNDYDLRKGIFAHAWYDVLLEEDGVLSVRWGIPLPF